MSKKFFNYLIISLLLIGLFPSLSSAQGLDINANFLILNISPENPEPLQTVKMTLTSYIYDLDRSKITWLVNGVIKKSEMGLREFSLLAGKNGQKTTVKVQVEAPTNDRQETELSFTPSLVDLVYESVSYTPPFYKGKALNPNQGVVLVTAIPELIKTNGEKIPAQNVIYSWKKDGKVEQASSGIGKNVFIYNGTVPIRDVTIEVTASSLAGDLYASKSVEITNVSPKIIFYENSPIYGIMFNKAVHNTVNLLTDEFSILAMPYFFSTGYAGSPALDYAWNLNDQTVDNQEPKNSFTVRVEKAGSGLANIGLKISNNVRIFQFTTGDYEINFNKQ